jgi:hypothetical protein
MIRHDTISGQVTSSPAPTRRYGLHRGGYETQTDAQPCYENTGVGVALQRNQNGHFIPPFIHPLGITLLRKGQVSAKLSQVDGGWQLKLALPASFSVDQNPERTKYSNTVL